MKKVSRLPARFVSMPINGFRIDTLGSRLTISATDLLRNSNGSPEDGEDDALLLSAAARAILEWSTLSEPDSAASHANSGEDVLPDDEIPDDVDEDVDRSLDSSEFRVIIVSRLFGDTWPPPLHTTTTDPPMMVEL